jgi:hypothetical protein
MKEATAHDGSASSSENPDPPASNGLARLAGTWTAGEQEEFNAAIAMSQQIDEELWQRDLPIR